MPLKDIGQAGAHDPALRKAIEEMPAVVYSSKRHADAPGRPEGLLAYIRTARGQDALAWLDKDGKSVTESQFDILRAAACEPATPAVPRRDNHHDLVQTAARQVAKVVGQVGGQLGRPSGARFRVYERLKRHIETMGDLLADGGLRQALDDVYRYPLRQSAVDVFNRQLPSISDAALADLVCSLRDDGRPAAPTGLAAAPLDAQAALTWTDPSDSTQRGHAHLIALLAALLPLSHGIWRCDA